MRVRRLICLPLCSLGTLWRMPSFMAKSCRTSENHMVLCPTSALKVLDIVTNLQSVSSALRRGLGWVDLDFGVPLSAHLHCLSWAARQHNMVELEYPSQPNPCLRTDGTPCTCAICSSQRTTVPWKNGAPTKIVRQDLPGCKYLLISFVSGIAFLDRCSCASEIVTIYCQHIVDASSNLMIVASDAIRRKWRMWLAGCWFLYSSLYGLVVPSLLRSLIAQFEKVLADIQFLALRVKKRPIL